MPIYQFRDDRTGEEYELYFKMGDPDLCRIGETRRIQGRTLRRLPPTLQEAVVEEDCSHVSDFHPPFWKAHRDMGGKFTKRGKVIMSSYGQIEKTVKHANAKYGENVTWDGPTRKIE